MSKKELLTSEEVRKCLKISKRTLQRRRDAGKIRYIHDGSMIRYRWEDIESYLNNYIMEPIDTIKGCYNA
jgi:excisionase family DNA binding protein